MKEFFLWLLSLPFIMISYTISYVVGLVLALALLFFWQLGFIKIVNWDKFPHWEGRMLAVSNHPSILDIFLVPALFWLEYLTNPFRYGPVVVADSNNFYNSWWFFWARPFMISVVRGNGWLKSAKEAFPRMVKVLMRWGILILFPGGGRDPNGKSEEERQIYKATGLRPFKDSVGRLVVEVPGLKVLCLSIKGSQEALPNQEGRLVALWRIRLKPITIVIGNVLQFTAEERMMVPREKAVKEITQKIFNEVVRCHNQL